MHMYNTMHADMHAHIYTMSMSSFLEFWRLSCPTLEDTWTLDTHAKYPGKGVDPTNHVFWDTSRIYRLPVLSTSLSSASFSKTNPICVEDITWINTQESTQMQN